MGKVYTRQSGKVSRKEDVFVRLRGNKEISVRRVEGYQYTRSEKQGQMRADFGQRSARAAIWRRANEHPPTADYRRLLRRYNRLRKTDPDRYTTFWNYIVSCM